MLKLRNFKKVSDNLRGDDHLKDRFTLVIDIQNTLVT
jgi:hypothetical protein